MKIAIIGATGMAGEAITREALDRGHDVSAIVRHGDRVKDLFGNDVDLIEKDAFELTRGELELFDVVIDAFATAPELAYLHVDLATHLISELRNTDKPRLVFILGAGSLKTGADNHLVLQNILDTSANEPFVEIPKSQLQELIFLQLVENVNWVGISPSFNFKKGPKTKALIGEDELITNPSGQSITTTGTMADAMLNEIEHPEHKNERFTVGNAE